MPLIARFNRVTTLTLAIGFATLWVICGPGPVGAQNTGQSLAPELPRVALDTAQLPVGGKTFQVRKGSDPQGAFDAAQPGDTIALEAGVAFRGNFILPKKTGSAWIVIRTSASDKDLPPAGTRVGARHFSVMPKLVSPNDSPAIQTAPGAHHYRFIGVEFSVAESVTRMSSIVAFGGRQTSLRDVPSNLILDRCFVHGHRKADTFQGVLLNSASSAIVNSRISDIHVRGRDSQAILGYNGPGPFKISNNYLEAAGENIMFGGADPAIRDLVPSDIEIFGNHLFKPASWDAADASYAGTAWTQKAIVELKNAQRVLIRGNVLENMPGVKGAALLLTPRNQGNTAPWSTVQDVSFRKNIVRNVAVGWKAQGTDEGFRSRQLRRVLIRNNLWLEIRRSFFYAIGPIDDLVIDHNTALPVSYSAYHVEGAPPLIRFQLTNNIIGGGALGLKFARAGDSRWLPEALVKQNALIGPGGVRAWDKGAVSGETEAFRKFLSASEAGVNGDGTLDHRSPLRDAGRDGRDVGVRFQDLDEAVRSVSPPPGS
jgi:hypothetical protein